MRVIAKTELGSNVLDRQNTRVGRPQTAEEAKQRWQSFNSKKSTVRNKLKIEQQGLCGYTEFNLEHFKSAANLDALSNGCHIEHIRPKSIYPQETFDYTNLLLSILDVRDEPLFAQDRFIGRTIEDDDSHRAYFGGHAKENFYDEEKFISPTDPDCERFFAFLEASGEIVPSPHLDDAEQEKAKYTINLLNLNHPYLKNQRRQRMAEVREDIDKTEDSTKIVALIELETTEYEAGQIASFPSAIKSLTQGA
ncbi:retron system putative HNH endonuclease [Marinomonas lutimaris]|jgi:uncharacterized protein (TIGR02646 family)|uniref:retron system putative HNH endonuclease n=1 Tax=Marinomonas lutimaris TaxID=2846746 RepID=UPI001CA4C5D7|nr:retron system putative HNH endonuclease [Marinomonas lutimaris]